MARQIAGFPESQPIPDSSVAESSPKENIV
jgi:hypothetical protein